MVDKNSSRGFPADPVLRAEPLKFPGRSTYTLLRKGGFTAELEFEIAEIILATDPALRVYYLYAHLRGHCRIWMVDLLHDICIGQPISLTESRSYRYLFSIR
jgi:hypothetical protein